MSDQITLAEVKAFIRNGNHSPLDFFNMDQIMEVPKVKNTFEKAERVEGENKELKTASQKAEEAHKAALDKIHTQAITAQADTLFGTLATERKLSTQQVAYAKKNFATFKTEAKDAEALKTDLQRFVDAQIKDYDGTLTAIGLKPAEHGGTGAPPPTETEEQKAARIAAEGGNKGAGAGDKEAAGATGDMTDPAKNELIPK